LSPGLSGRNQPNSPGKKDAACARLLEKAEGLKGFGRIEGATRRQIRGKPDFARALRRERVGKRWLRVPTGYALRPERSLRLRDFFFTSLGSRGVEGRDSHIFHPHSGEPSSVLDRVPGDSVARSGDSNIRDLSTIFALP